MHQKTEVEAWISRHVELYCITSTTRIYNYLSKVQRQTQARGTQAVAWATPWGVNTQGLREGLTKAENTMATLLRTGIIGLKD